MEILLTLIFLAVLIFVALSVYFFVYKKIESNAPIKISSSQLINSGQKNFNNRLLEVTGKISKITYNGSEYVMTLDNDINCYFKYSTFPIVLAEGKIITVRGIYFYNGINGLKKCSV